jgi:hypothetical protein
MQNGKGKQGGRLMLFDFLSKALLFVHERIAIGCTKG